jgi:hypothetical protein
VLGPRSAALSHRNCSSALGAGGAIDMDVPTGRNVDPYFSRMDHKLRTKK